MKRLLVVPMVLILALATLIWACSGKGGTAGPTQIPATPEGQCQAAYDHLVSLADAAVPGDEDEVHDLISEYKSKDEDKWLAACMKDQGKAAVCAIKAQSLPDVDACNAGAAAPLDITIRPTAGEMVAMVAHVPDILAQKNLEGRELDPEVRKDIHDEIAKAFSGQETADASAQDMESEAKLQHGDIACFLAVREWKALPTCMGKVCKHDRELCDRMMEATGAHAVPGGPGGSGGGESGESGE